VGRFVWWRQRATKKDIVLHWMKRYEEIILGGETVVIATR
jgi:hypothetical protein